MKKSRVELIFESDDEIRRLENELKVRRWTRDQLWRLMEKEAQHTSQRTFALKRLIYRLKKLFAPFVLRIIKR